MGLGVQRVPVTVASGQTTSSVLDLTNCQLVGMILTNGWDGGDLTLTGAPEIGGVQGGTYGAVSSDPGTGTPTAIKIDGATANTITLLTLACPISGFFAKFTCSAVGANRTIYALVQHL